MPRRPRTPTGSRQRGRPALDEANRRTHTVGVRLSPLELELLDQVRGGASRGAWLRDAALSANNRKAVQQPPPAVNLQTYRQLAGVANNLNQLVRQLHETKRFDQEVWTNVRSLLQNTINLVQEVQVQVLVKE